MLAWGVVSLAGLPPLDGPLPAAEGPGLLAAMAIVSIPLYGWAAWRTLILYRGRGGALPLSISVALVLLAEAMLAITLSRNWQLSWWEWHVLMLVAFAAIAIGVRREYASTGSLTGAFGGLYLQGTLNRIDRWHGRAIARVAAAQDRGESAETVTERLRGEGASADEVRLISHAAGELRRLDAAFRPYLPSIIADRAADEPAVARLGGAEQEVSVLFADLSAFTTFSERHAPTEVITMLNEYWAVVVPVIDAAGGEIEQFAGDAVMAIFNVEGDQPDHPVRAARAAIAIIEAGRAVLAMHPDWPAFRVGVSTGHAVVGNVGTRGRRSFAVIGDTTNTAARLMSVAGPAGGAGDARDVGGARRGAPRRGPGTRDREGPARAGRGVAADHPLSRRAPATRRRPSGANRRDPSVRMVGYPHGGHGMAHRLAPLASIAILAVAATPALAAPFPPEIALPGGWAPEGITDGRGTTAYVGSLSAMGIAKVNVRTGAVDPLEASAGEVIVGLDYEDGAHRIWAAGGNTGEVRAYDAATGALLETYTFGPGFLNDVVVTEDAVFVTNSNVQELEVIPLPADGSLPDPDDAFALPLTGELVFQAGFNVNGIVAFEGWLILVQSNTGRLFRADPATGATTAIDLGGASVSFGDGLELRGATLFVVRNQLEQVAVFKLADDALSGRLVRTLTSPELDIPTTTAFIAGRLWTVNARFGTPVTPETPYELTRLLR